MRIVLAVVVDAVRRPVLTWFLTVPDEHDDVRAGHAATLSSDRPRDECLREPATLPDVSSSRPGVRETG
jgi:hypothetical protein